MMIPDFPPIRVAPEGAPEREAIRAFLDERLGSLSPAERARSWAACDARFSRDVGKQGWIGLTWPEKFGGKAASHLVRYRIVEELLAAGAPVAAHWFADRQSGTMLLRYASDTQKARLLPRMASGELYFCIGMSEPNSGSDLASLRTHAERDGENWRVTGSKIWTSHAQHAHYMIALVRTGSEESDRRTGLSQFIIDLSSPGVTIRPIEDQTGDAHFCELFLDDVPVPADMLLGEPGNGWAQVNAELALERSGPERFLSSHVLIEEALKALSENPSETLTALVGHWTAELWTLRQMSLAVAGKLERGGDPMVEASIVKDLGAQFEQSVPRALQAAWDEASIADESGALDETLTFLIGASPSFSLRGGTREILRGIIARGLGLR